MPRKKRIITDIGVYHIMVRGNNKQKIFLQEYDKYHFLKKLFYYCSKTGIKVYAYCLMPNHIHLLIGNCGDLLESFTKKLFGSYAMYFNKRYNRIGHLFQDRFKSEPVVDERYFKTVFNYILKNSQKANICEYSQYKWSSYSLTMLNSEKIDIGFLCSIFGSFERMILFLEKTESDDSCMDYDEKMIQTDDECIQYIQRNFNISNMVDIKSMDKNQRNKMISQTKQKGFSIRQIMRVTGLSRGVIQEA